MSTLKHNQDSTLGQLPVDEARVSKLDLAGEEVFVLSLPLAERRSIPDLTDSEQAIVELLWRGHTTAEIADQRGTRYLTVAKQLNSIYRKAGVVSCGELLAWMAHLHGVDEP